MAPTWTDLLIRDSGQDTGQVPSPGYPYTSPDVICTQQTEYPAQQFGTGASYATDPALPVKSGQNNFFYVRAKNLGAQSQGGQAYLYWSKSSLNLNPSLWYSEQLQVSIGGTWHTNNPLPAVGNGQVSVTKQPFAWTPPAIGAGAHFCLVAAVGTSLHAWPPPEQPSFPSEEAFILWVRNNQNICWRNLSLVSDPHVPEWDRVDGLSNPYDKDRTLLVLAECRNVPAGSQVTLRCTTLGIAVTAAITNPVKQIVYGQAVTCPAGFDGYVESLVQLPSGASWPSGAQLRVRSYFAVSREVAAFAADFGSDARHPHVAKALQLARGVDDGVLVEVGNCTTAYAGAVGG